MSLLLYRNSLLCAAFTPYDYIKYFYHNIFSMDASTPNISYYDELFQFILCLLEKLFISPLAREMISHMCPWKSSWTTYEAPTHHLNMDISPPIKVIFIPIVYLSYFGMHLCFTQYY